MKKRLVSLLLVFAMIWNIPSVTAWASVKDLLGNTAAQNSEILSRLSALTGGKGAEALALLKQLGLLDENGNLNVDQSIEMDGKTMTLSEAETLLDDPKTDLSRTATVGGTSISLKNLKTVVQIEQQLAEIKEKYFSGKAFSQEQLVQLQSLMSQIGTDGISAQVQDAGSLASLYLYVTEDSSSSPDTVTYGTQAKYIYHLSMSGSMPSDRTVSFSWKYMAGLLPAAFYSASLTLTNKKTNQSVTCPEGKSITLGKTSGDLQLDSGYDLSGTLTLTVGSNAKNLGNLLGCNVSGDLYSYVEFYNGDGVAFTTSSAADASGLLDLDKITIQKPKPFDYAGSAWLTAMQGATQYDKNMTNYLDTGHNEYTNPSWQLVNSDDKDMENNTVRLEDTAKEIYGSDNPEYQVDAAISIYGAGAAGYMKNALPIGSDGDYSNNQLMTTLSYRWNGKSVSQTNNTLQTEDGNTPYISIGTSSAPSAQSVSIVMQSPNGKAPLDLRTVWPGNPIFCRNLTDTSTNLSMSGSPEQRTESSSIKVYDVTPPTVESAEIPAGTYYSGEYVPITITFSEPVKASGIFYFHINGNKYKPSDLQIDTTGRKAVALYKVLDVDDAAIHISAIDVINDLVGNTATAQTENNNGAGWDFPGVTLKSALMKDAVTGIQVSSTSVAPEDAADGVTVTLQLKQAEADRTKYAAYDTSGGEKQKAPFAVRYTNTETGETKTVPAYLAESGSTLSAEAAITGLSAADSDTPYQVSVVAYEDSTDTPGTVVAKTTAFTVKAVTFANGVSINYPDDNTAQLSLSGTYRPKLTVSFTGSPTYTTGSWSSSDDDIATIDATGQVALTGKKIGRVTFTFTADDGGLTDPDSSNVKSCRSIEYTVAAGSSPALVVPDEANRIVIKKGGAAQVRWSSNAAFFPSGDFEYTIELFKGNYTEEDLKNESPVYSVTAGKNENSAEIPSDELTELSDNGTPSYTVRISMPHPKISTETLSAVCYIVVKAAPAAVHLTQPAGGLYLLDTQTATVKWSVDNFVTGKTDAKLDIERISTDSGGTDVTDPIYTEDLTHASGSYTLTPAEVGDGGLKDTYMVSLKAKNEDDAGYSSDSFPLYVYNPDALKLNVGDEDVTGKTVKLDDESKVDGTKGALPTDTDDIMKLREELALIEYVGINYKDHSWSQLKDGIKWSTSDDSAVSVNYRQGGLFENIKNFSMNTYLPETKMALSSVTDGTATITATHANTGMSASVTVDVHTLRQKFYLFQLTPAQKTALTYTDGKGVEKTVETNDEGVLALYEPNGINSDVSLRAKDGSGNVWLGTIAQSSLLSGERDATRLQLYPLNTFKLRQTAKAEIFLKKPDGSAYTGTLTLRGGVYKNDGYCQNADLLGNEEPGLMHPLKDGKGDQTITVGSDGKLTVYMDSTQFWSQEKGEDASAAEGLSPTDNIQFIFELTGLTGYTPQLVYANGNLTMDDLIRSADSVVTLEAVSGSPQPFISNQTVDYGLSGGRLIDVRHSTGHIGPNSTYPEVKLNTTVMLWGEDAGQDYTLQLCDEDGYVPKAQTSQYIKYPFSTFPVVRNTLTLSKKTVTDSGWIPDGKDAGLKVRLSQGGDMLREIPVSSRVTDLTGVSKLTDSEDVSGLLVDLQSDGSVAAPASMSSGDKVINGFLGVMSKINGPVNGTGTSYKMIISPGSDNSTFNAFIWAGYDSLGLDDVDYSSTGLYVDTDLADSQLSTAPGLNDITDMAKGEYSLNQGMKEADDAKTNKKGVGSTDYSGQLEGYFEAQIRYNFTDRKWEINVLGGGFTAGFGASYTYNFNADAGPVPVTASFSVGGSIQLDFKAALRYSEVQGLKWSDTVTGDTVNDYLTTLRIDAYVNAFGGLGIDYSVIALKVGLFGNLSVDSQNEFLSRTYLADQSKRQINGQAVAIEGQVGIKFVAKFLFLSYEFVLASVKGGWKDTFNDWDTISDYWDSAGSGIQSVSAKSLAAASAQTGLETAHVAVTLQSRDYLSEYTRKWSSGSLLKKMMAFFSADSGTGLKDLETNAYPYSLPLLSDDGRLMVYASDQNSTDVAQTRIFASYLENGSYTQGTEIPAPDNDSFEGYGDSGASFAGTSSFAAAAWVRQSATLNKSAGETLTSAEQALMTNATEIVASVYDNGTWTSTRLTDNSTPDLAPVVATNGTQVIVAWRSVYAGDKTNPTDFSDQDTILYRIYDNGTWSDAKQFYNGSSGAVKGIQAAMLPDGTAAVVYTLDPDSTDGSSDDYEIGYTVIKAESVKDSGKNDSDDVVSAMITHDSCLDENPQIAAVYFADGSDRFVLGWHSVQNGTSDIRLAAVDRDGLLSNSFIDSISQAVNGSSVSIGGDFRFAKMSEAVNSLSNLSILWPESTTNDEGEQDHSVLKAVKFTEDADGKIGISAPLQVAELPDRTLLNQFDAYVSSDDGRTIKAVIQGAQYKEIDTKDSGTYEVYQDGSGENVYVAKDESKLFTATATYENKARVDSLGVDYANLSLNTLVPVQFTVFNAGLDTMDSVDIDLEGSPTTFDNLDLAPNESKTLTCWYSIGDSIENLSYTLNANFDDGSADTETGTVYLDYPDIGISQFKTVSEENGIRTMQLTLYNDSAATLSGGKSRSVRIGFYDNSDFTADSSTQSVTCSTPGVTVNSDKTLTISGEDALKEIDDGAFTIEVSFNIGQYVRGKGFKEIPNSGIRLYANTWAEEENTTDGSQAELPEYSKSNNSASVLLESALARSEHQVAITLEQGLSGGDTTADVSLHNNSIQNQASGNLIVSLLDGTGKVLEQQQTYQTGDSSSLVSLGGEETQQRSFTFHKKGSRVTAAFGNLTLADNSAGLSSLSFEGLPVQLSDFTAGSAGNSYACTDPNTTLNSTRVSFVAENPQATVTVKANGTTVGGNGSNSIPLRHGTNTITVTVTAANQQATTAYTMTVSSGVDKVLQSIRTPVAVTGLKNGTAKTAQALKLPATVAVNTDCGTDSAPVAWDLDSCSYQSSSVSQQSFTVNGTVSLPFGVSNPNSVPLQVSISVTVLPKSSSSGSKDKTDTDNRQQSGAGYISDTTHDLTVNGAYQFRITSRDGSVPSFVVGTSGVFSVQMVKKTGNDYFFRVTAVGKPGDRAGIYINGGPRLLILTVGSQIVSGGAVSDTTGVFDVQAGKKYQFKIVSDRKPVLIPGSSTFRCIEVTHVGMEWYFKFIAVGLPGEGCGFYLNGGGKPVAIANIR